MDEEIQEEAELDKALECMRKREEMPKTNILSHATTSKSTLQQMLNQPFLPPCMVFESKHPEVKKKASPIKRIVNSNI